MAARWMQPKLAKMKRDRGMAPLALFAPQSGGKQASTARAGHSVEASNIQTAEVRALCAAFTGVVTVCRAGQTSNGRVVGPTQTWRKRGGSIAGQKLGSAVAPDGHKGVARNTNGNYYELWSTAGDRLVSSR